MRIILVRHGETLENKEGIIQGGTIQGVLSPEGIAQAENLAVLLKDTPIDAIYSSDLKRAVDTAHTIAAYHPHVPFILTSTLRERSLPEYEGKRKSDLGIEGYVMNKEHTPEGGETLEQLYHRAGAFLELVKSANYSVVVAVCHNGIGTAIVAASGRKGWRDIPDLPRIANADPIVLDI